MEIEVYVGKFGFGKSQTVKKKYPDAYWKDQTKWWDDYSGQEVVIWDDFYGHCCPFTTLLKLIDSNPFRVEIKGSTVAFTSKKFVFTSNEIPSR